MSGYLKRTFLIGLILCLMLVLVACTKKETGYYKYESVDDPNNELNTLQLAMMKMFADDMFLILDNDGNGFVCLEMFGEGDAGEITWDDDLLIGPQGRKIEMEYDEETEELTLIGDGGNVIFRKTKDETEINRMKSKRKKSKT